MTNLPNLRAIILSWTLLICGVLCVASKLPGKRGVFDGNLIHAPDLPSVLNNTLRAALGPRRVPKCGGFCRFTLCTFPGQLKYLPRVPFYLLNPGQAGAQFVCRRGTSVGQVLGTLPAKIASDGKLVQISKWTPPGLEQKYPRDFFGTEKIPLLPFSGISRKDVVGNQWNFLHNRCVVLPITSYQLVDSDNFSPFPDPVVVGRGRRNCVAFRTTAPFISIRVTWDSSDDFDLSLTEPDGARIDNVNLRTECGKLNGDNNKGFCDSGIPRGSEDIVYFPSNKIKFGIYRVTLRHFDSCAGKRTKWKLNIVKLGREVKVRQGVSRQGGNKAVITTTFKFP